MKSQPLARACELEFHADTFEEMADLCKKHGMEMFQAGDKDHLEAMKKMQDLLQTPDAMQKWFNEKRAEFDALPSND